MMTSEKLIGKLDRYPSCTKTLLDLNKRLSDIVGMRNNYDECMPSASVISDMPKGSGEKDQTFMALMSIENVLVRYKKDIDYLSAEIIRIMDGKEIIDRILRWLPYNDSRIIELRHFQNRTWEWMSPYVYVSRTWLPRVHKKIIDSMVKQWNLQEGGGNVEE